MRRLLVLTLVVGIWLPLLFALSLGPLCAVYRAGWVSPRAWMSLTGEGPYRPLAEFCVEGEGWLADRYRWWVLLWDR